MFDLRICSGVDLLTRSGLCIKLQDAAMANTGISVTIAILYDILDHKGITYMGLNPYLSHCVMPLDTNRFYKDSISHAETHATKKLNICSNAGRSMEICS